MLTLSSIAESKQHLRFAVERNLAVAVFIKIIIVGKIILMLSKHTFIFIDTQIFLHFQFFTEISWEKIVDAKTVTLIIPPIILKEIDKHKYNHSLERVRERASKITKLFRKQLRDSNEIRPNVNIKFERVEPQIEFEKYALSRDAQDDHLLASIFRFQNEQNEQNENDCKVALISDDSALIVKAEMLGIDLFELDDEYRNKSEDNPEKRKIEKLESKIRQLENLRPKLIITSVNKESYLTAKRVSDNIKFQDEIEQELLRFRENYPCRHLVETPDYMKTLQGFAYNKFTIINQQNEQYNKNLEKFYVAFEQYAAHKSNIAEIKNKTVVFDIELSNNGNLPAEDIDIFITFPPFVKISIDSNDFEFPKPPDSTDFLNDSIYGSLRVINPKDFNFNISQSLLKDLKSKTSKKLIAEGNGFICHFWQSNLKHTHSIKLENIYCTFLNIEEIKPFEIQYKITAANLPEPSEKTLDVKVYKN